MKYKVQKRINSLRRCMFVHDEKVEKQRKKMQNEIFESGRDDTRCATICASMQKSQNVSPRKIIGHTCPFWQETRTSKTPFCSALPTDPCRTNAIGLDEHQQKYANRNQFVMQTSLSVRPFREKDIVSTFSLLYGIEHDVSSIISYIKRVEK